MKNKNKKRITKIEYQKDIFDEIPHDVNEIKQKKGKKEKLFEIEYSEYIQDLYSRW